MDENLLSRNRARMLVWADRLFWLAPLVGRLSVGLLFVSTGWGKVHSLDKVTQFFVKLGIPAPGFNATLVAYTELICGALLVIGLFTRLAALPLMVTMVTALLTAKLADIHGIFDLVGAEELTYLCVLIILAIIGPGAVSLDALLVRRWLDQPDRALNR